MVKMLDIYRRYRDNINDLTKEEKLELIDLCDFNIIEKNDYYKLNDRQNVNLGNIESEKFDSYDNILDRISHYLYDIFIRNGEAEYQIKKTLRNSIAKIIDQSMEEYYKNLIEDIDDYDSIYKVKPDVDKFKEILIKNLRSDQYG